MHWLRSLFTPRAHAGALPSVAFCTAVWERDWKSILLSPDYLRVYQIENHAFPFRERILVINNVSDAAAVTAAAERHLAQGTLTRIVRADEVADDALHAVHLTRASFRADASAWPGVSDDWLYFNALAPLAAIHAASCEYILYMTGDSRLDRKVAWVAPALRRIMDDEKVQIANPVWNDKYAEARNEAYKKEGDFWVARQGFSDQVFLGRRSLFHAPIYSEVRADAAHFPHGDTFEKRVFSHLKNHNYERLIYRRGSYTHANIHDEVS